MAKARLTFKDTATGQPVTVHSSQIAATVPDARDGGETTWIHIKSDRLIHVRESAESVAERVILCDRECEEVTA